MSDREQADDPRLGIITTGDSLSSAVETLYPGRAIVVDAPLQSATEEKLRSQFDAEFDQLNATDRDFIWSCLKEPDGGYTLATELPNRFTPKQIHLPGGGTPQRAWEVAGCTLMQNRPTDAILVFEALYNHMLRYEADERAHVHKGMPLCWISDCLLKLGYPAHAKRYLMYTLCEDAAEYGPNKRANGSGVYYRAVGQHQMTEPIVLEYTKRGHQIYEALGPPAWFPERVLCELDDRWMTNYPSHSEYGQYMANQTYIRHLLGQAGKAHDRGLGLERLAQSHVNDSRM
jgi:hypothetical protein